MIRVLNAYAGIGGNRKLWEGVEVVAVDNDPVVCGIYQRFFPNDRVIFGDAHLFIEENYQDFDFIWSSPPCQSHSRARQPVAANSEILKAVYPDAKLWQEILFLKHYFKGFWVVENVRPYYDILIPPTARMHRHWFWSNYWIPDMGHNSARINISNSNVRELERLHGMDLSGFDIPGKDRRRQLLRNCVWPPLGQHVFNQAPFSENKDRARYQQPLIPFDENGV